MGATTTKSCIIIFKVIKILGVFVIYIYFLKKQTHTHTLGREKEVLIQKYTTISFKSHDFEIFLERRYYCTWCGSQVRNKLKIYYNWLYNSRFIQSLFYGFSFQKKKKKEVFYVNIFVR